MLNENAKLEREKDRNGKPTGCYVCSLCGERFKPNPANHGEMRTTFRVHVGAKHSGETPREDVNQAAARVVREATEKAGG
jgi:hypothetical protein